MPGSITSSSTRSNFSVSIRSAAFSPSGAQTQEYPALRRFILIRLAMGSSSSAISIFNIISPHLCMV